MKTRYKNLKIIALSLALLMAVPPGIFAQADDKESDGEEKLLNQEELDQLLAPIALYPDSLLAQIFMAATYPLEIVEADRWTKQNEKLTSDALTKALEAQSWDPSVKSLVNFPQVLTMMNQELAWTQKLGDAFLAQQKDVMATVQKLREKAQAAGNLKTTEQQKVVVQKETQTIVVEPANPQVVYVPTYNPSVVYGPWMYPSYPPYAYYPPGYVAGAAVFSFGVGMAVGAAWGYAWGGCNWRGGHVDVDINRNININRNIDRNRYKGNISRSGGGRGQWQHNPAHRKGVAYRDPATARKFNRGDAANVKSREAFRGRAEAGRKNPARDGGSQTRDQLKRNRNSTAGRKNLTSMDQKNIQAKKDTVRSNSAGRSKNSRQQNIGRTHQSRDRSAFGGYDKGSRTRNMSRRGHQSMSSHHGGGRTGGGRRGR